MIWTVILKEAVWLNIEATAVQGSSLRTLFFSKTESPCKLIGNNFILRNSLRILNQIRSICKLLNTSVHTPICHNHSFLPFQVDRVFVDWRDSGLVALKDLHVDKHLASFVQLITKLTNSHHIRHLQIRHYGKGVFPNLHVLSMQRCRGFVITSFLVMSSTAQVLVWCISVA